MAFYVYKSDVHTDFFYFENVFVWLSVTYMIMQ